MRPYSGANHIDVRLAYQPGSVALEIEDNRTGLSEVGGGGFGVEGMRDRARPIGGQIDIRTQTDRGTEGTYTSCRLSIRSRTETGT